MGDSLFGYRERSSSTGLMDWLETPNSHIIKIDVPGFGKDAMKVQIEDGNWLHVRAEGGAKEDSESGTTKEAVWHVSERRVCGRDFSMSVQLPSNVKADQVKAQVENGVLTVVIPKDNSTKASSVRNVKITSSCNQEESTQWRVQKLCQIKERMDRLSADQESSSQMVCHVQPLKSDNKAALLGHWRSSTYTRVTLL